MTATYLMDKYNMPMLSQRVLSTSLPTHENLHDQGTAQQHIPFQDLALYLVPSSAQFCLILTHLHTPA